MEYNYEEQVRADVDEFIRDNFDFEEKDVDEFNAEKMKGKICEEILERGWEITGASNGSYTCNAYRAEEYLEHNWDLLREAAEVFYPGSDAILISKGPESCDVLIREYLLPRIVEKAVDDAVDEYLENLDTPEYDTNGHLIR